MLLDELDPMPGELQPFVALFQIIVQAGQQPAYPAHYPHGLVGTEELSFPVEEGGKPAVFPIRRMLDPERKRIVNEFAVKKIAQ
jgi:hypothetical protein